MKKYISIFCIAAAILAAGSCSKENINREEVTPSDSSKMVEFTFTAEYPETLGTKTEVDNLGNVSWKEGDQISLYYLKGGVPATALATAQGNGNSVKFTAVVPDGVAYFYATYPKEIGTLTDSGNFSMSIAGSTDGSFAAANYSAAYSLGGENVVFQFKNAVGLIRVQLPSGAVVSHNAKDYNISSISVCGKTEDISCLGTVTVTPAGSDINFSAPADPTDVSIVNLSAAVKTSGYAYIPCLPFTATNGITINFGSDDGAIPALATIDSKAVTLESGHIKPLGDLSSTIIWDWYFAESGTGDGKTSGTPAGVAAFQKILNDTQYTYGERKLNGATLHLADGTYSLTSAINVVGSETGEIVVEGASMNGTKIDGAGIAETRMFTFNTANNITFRNLTIQNGTCSSNGGAVFFTQSSASKCTLENATFYQNSSTGGNSGAIYFGNTGLTTITNCTFDQNTAKTQGGAFSMSGSAGDMQIKGTTFNKNKVTNTGTNSGGAIYDAGPGLLTIESSLFNANSCATQGGAIKLDNAAGKLFISASHFEGNSISKSGYGDYGGSIYSGANKGVIGCYNCTFHYNHASASSSSSSAFSAEKYIVANCTMVESVKVSYGVISNRATADNTSTAVNNILLTTSTTDTHPSLSMSANASYNHLTSAYNVLTRIQTNFTAASEDATSILGKYKADLGLADSSAETPYFAWDGTTGIDGFTKCTLSDIETKIKANTAFGTEFWAWLESIGVTDKDVRGVTRTTTAMWPGSYQQD